MMVNKNASIGSLIGNGSRKDKAKHVEEGVKGMMKAGYAAHLACFCCA